MSMLAALMLMPATALLAPRASTFPRTSQPVTMLLARASTCPRTSQPVMLVDVIIPAVDDITLASSTLASQLLVPRGPLDVARDFVGPIMFSINNDPLWQSAKLVGMVGATVYQIRNINLIRATQIGAAPKLDQAAHSTWRNSRSNPNMILVPVVLIADTFSSLIDGVRAGLGGPPPESPEEVLQRVRDIIQRPTRE